tara:strand:+ start:314 stop:862 length:549 start_codon:yes stop_codon:yes gene_type:complete
MHDYIDYIFNNAQKEKSDEAPIKINVVPVCIGGQDVAENSFYTSEENWIQANIIAMKFLETFISKKAGKRHAKYVIKKLSKLSDTEDKAYLASKCQSFLDKHGNTNAPRTLYHESGKTAYGTLQQLEIQTALSYDRVRDLTTGRRRYTGGWCASEKEARKGRLTPGRKPKKKSVMEFFENPI